MEGEAPVEPMEGQAREEEAFGDNMDGEDFGPMDGMDGEQPEGDFDEGGEGPGDQMEQYDDQQQHEGNDEPIEYAELVKVEVLGHYREVCEAAQQEPNEAFCVYLEETFDENDALDIVI